MKRFTPPTKRTSLFAMMALAGVLAVTPPTQLEARSSRSSGQLPSMVGIGHQGDWGQLGNHSATIQANADFVKAARVAIDGSSSSAIFTELSHRVNENGKSSQREQWIKEVSIRVNNSREPVMVSCDIATTAHYDATQQMKPCDGVNVLHNKLVDARQTYTQRIVVDSATNETENDTVLINVSYL